MIEILVDEGLRANTPNLVLGIVHAPVEVTKYNDVLWEEINKVTERIASDFSLATLHNVPGIAGLRDGYKAIGKDPARYRGSAEALARRVIQGKGLYRVNTVVDINNLISLESMHSVGSYDLARLHQPITFRIGENGESYKGIGKETINIAELPVFADENGPFGSPTSDSERAMITSETHDLMMVVISFTGRKSLQKHLDQIAELLCYYASAPKNQIETFIV